MELPLLAVKPYWERVGDLAQGLEVDGPVEVVATKIFGRGKFYVAMSRCRELANLKVTGLNGFADLRRVVKSNWRAIHFHLQHNQPMPQSSESYARSQLLRFQTLMAGQEATVDAMAMRC